MKEYDQTISELSKEKRFLYPIDYINLNIKKKQIESKI